MNPLSPIAAAGQQPDAAAGPTGARAPGADNNPGNSLAALVSMEGGGGFGAGPTLSIEQAAASVGYFGEIQSKLSQLIKNPKLGKQSLRPDLFEIGADLLADGFMTMPALMNEIKSFPPDPGAQKAWIVKRIEMSQKAQNRVLQDIAMLGQNMKLGSFSDELAKMKVSEDPMHKRMDGVVDIYKGAGRG